SSLTPPPESTPDRLPAGSDGAQASSMFAALPDYTAPELPGPQLEPTNAAALQAEPAWPLEEDSAQQDDVSPRELPAGTGPRDENGLTALDEPISLDDLIAGTSAAGPFVDPDDGASDDSFRANADAEEHPGG